MKELIKKRFAFAALILGAMLADVILAVLGASEAIVVSILCVCIILVVIHDILGVKCCKASEEEDGEVSDLEGFFKKGGIAYRWNKGDKEREKCHSIDTLFDGKKTDYVELWLGDRRYFIKDMEEWMMNDTDTFLHKSKNENDKFFDNLSSDRLI